METTTLKISVSVKDKTLIEFLKVPSFFIQSENDFSHFIKFFGKLFPMLTGIPEKNISIEIVMDEKEKALADEIGTELMGIALNANN